MVLTARIALATCGFGDRRSIYLSYASKMAAQTGSAPVISCVKNRRVD